MDSLSLSLCLCGKNVQSKWSKQNRQVQATWGRRMTRKLGLPQVFWKKTLDCVFYMYTVGKPIPKNIKAYPQAKTETLVTKCFQMRSVHRAGYCGERHDKADGCHGSICGGLCRSVRTAGRPTDCPKNRCIGMAIGIAHVHSATGHS